MARPARLPPLGADQGCHAQGETRGFHPAPLPGLRLPGGASPPLPLPGESATISCPHSYPLFYEALGLDEGHRLLEVGLGSGYGAALAREIVGDSGLVVSLEIYPLTFDFARQNLAAAGYRDIVLVNAYGGLGWPDLAPYDRICVTAACPQVPPPLVEQLVPGGLLAAPVMSTKGQDLVLVEKRETETSSQVVCQVLYVSLRGKFGEE